MQAAAPWLDPNLAALVHGLLARDPGDRCQSAAELVAALEPYCADSVEVSATMLVPIAAEVRAQRSEPAQLPSCWQPTAPSAPPPPIARRPRDPHVGQAIGADYRLLQRLGSDGDTTVYEAEDSEGARRAVLVGAPGSELAAEGAIDSGTEDGRPFCVTDLTETVSRLPVYEAPPQTRSQQARSELAPAIPQATTPPVDKTAKWSHARLWLALAAIAFALLVGCFLFLVQ